MDALFKRKVFVQDRNQEIELVVMHRDLVTDRELAQVRKEYPRGTIRNAIFADEMDYDLKGVDGILRSAVGHYSLERPIPSPLLLIVRPIPADELIRC